MLHIASLRFLWNTKGNVKFFDDHHLFQIITVIDTGSYSYYSDWYWFKLVHTNYKIHLLFLVSVLLARSLSNSSHQLITSIRFFTLSIIISRKRRRIDLIFCSKSFRVWRPRSRNILYICIDSLQILWYQ